MDLSRKWLKEHTVSSRASLVRILLVLLARVDRWQKVCGCTPQAYWKTPFREALNQIGEWLDAAFWM
jgi:hypothetical protein